MPYTVGTTRRLTDSDPGTHGPGMDDQAKRRWQHTVDGVEQLSRAGNFRRPDERSESELEKKGELEWAEMLSGLYGTRFDRRRFS